MPRKGLLWVVTQSGESWQEVDQDSVAERIRTAIGEPEARVLVMPPGCELEIVDLDSASLLGLTEEDDEEDDEEDARREGK